MTAAPARLRFTGTVVVDVSGYVDASGWLTPEGQQELWRALAGAAGLPVRVMVGTMAAPPSLAVLEAAAGCLSVEVCGTDPHGVADTLRVLRAEFGRVIS